MVVQKEGESSFLFHIPYYILLHFISFLCASTDVSLLQGVNNTGPLTGIYLPPTRSSRVLNNQYNNLIIIHNSILYLIFEPKKGEED